MLLDRVADITACNCRGSPGAVPSTATRVKAAAAAGPSRMHTYIRCCIHDLWNVAEPLPELDFPDEASSYGYGPDSYYGASYEDTYYAEGEGSGSVDSYYADAGPSLYEEYYAAYSGAPEEPPPVVAAPSGLGPREPAAEQRASFAVEASLQLASCDSAADVALATTELLQSSMTESLVTLEVIHV